MGTGPNDGFAGEKCRHTPSQYLCDLESGECLDKLLHLVLIGAQCGGDEEFIGEIAKKTNMKDVDGAQQTERDQCRNQNDSCRCQWPDKQRGSGHQNPGDPAAVMQQCRGEEKRPGKESRDLGRIYSFCQQL
jgi:hypothetical protein